MKRKLTVYSASYPYGSTETFLHNEIVYLSNFFHIEIYPLLKKPNNSKIQNIPENVNYHEPFLPRSYVARILLGVFNFSPLLCFFSDLIKVIRYSNNFRYSIKEWFLYMVTYRALYANSRFRDSIQKSDILYFYWAQFPINWLPNDLNLFVRVHGGEVNFQRHHGYVPMVSDKIIANKATYLAISEDSSKRIHLINREASVILSRLGVNFNGRNPEPKTYERLRIVSCSNLIALKRVHIIIEALSHINDVELEWIHFGDGVLMDKLKEEASKLPKNICVKFKGRVSNDLLMKFYQSTPIDLFVNVSETEGVPVSVMEALSFGIPCFATGVGGTSEILNERGGKVVVKNFEIEELIFFIKNIRSIINSENLRNGAFQLWKNKCEASTNFEIVRKTFEAKC